MTTDAHAANNLDDSGSADRGHGRVARWVPKLAHWMYTRFLIPGTSIRFGLDPILGFIPVLGDTITALIGLLMIREARRLGLGISVILAIIKNLLLDWVVGLIPGLDLVLDTAVKAHTRNAELLARHAKEGARKQP